MFRDLGTDTTTAIRIFLTQALAANGFPFEIKRISKNPYEKMTENEIVVHATGVTSSEAAIFAEAL